MAKIDRKLNPVVDDMSNLTNDRLRRVIADCGDTAHRAGLDDDTVGKIIIASLLLEVITGTLSMGMDRTHYLSICMLAYDELISTLERKRGSGPTRTA
jgi:hypothetical protein